MAHCKYRMATALILAAALGPFTGCNRTETPAPIASFPSEKTSTPVPEPPTCHDCIPVTADNFNRAESDMYFDGTVKNGGFGKLSHNRGVMPIDKQAVIRANRDTLYSAAVFDLDAGPVTVAMPVTMTDAGE